MSIVVIGVNHRTGPLSLLERLAIAPDDLRQGHRRPGRSRQHPRGRRAQHVQPHRGLRRRRALPRRLRRHPRLLLRARQPAPRRAAPAPLQPARRGRGRAPVRGRRRARLGRARRERDPRSGARRRGRSPQDEGGAAPTLNLLFRHALETSASGPAPRPRSAAATASVSHAAVEMATERLGALAGRSVLVVGAGEMGEGVAAALRQRRRRIDIIVANRTPRARQPTSPSASAARSSASTSVGDALAARRRRAHVHRRPARSSSTRDDRRGARAGAERPLLDRRHRRAAQRRPRGRRAAPASPLLDLDDLRDWAAEGIALRAGEADHVRAIVAEEVERFAHRGRRPARPRRSSPQLHERAEQIRRPSSSASPAGSPTLDDAERDAVEALTRAIVAKLLHRPVGAAAGRRRHAARASATPPPCATCSTWLTDGRPPADALRLATRGSPQARTQAAGRRRRAAAAPPGCDVELVLVETTGDRRQDVPLHTIGGQGVFVKEVQQAVLDGRADLAVHSAKDLPVDAADGADDRRVLRSAAIAADALVGRSARRARPRARRSPPVRCAGGPSSPRRARTSRSSSCAATSQTRLSKVPDGGAIVMAVAALRCSG